MRGLAMPLTGEASFVDPQAKVAQLLNEHSLKQEEKGLFSCDWHKTV
jgi:hypothetical protein